MAKRSEIEILLSVEDKVSRALDNVGKEAKTLDKAFKKSAININASLELVEKGITSISKGLDFIKKGARFDQQQDAFERLARSVGTSSDEILRNMQKMSGGTMSAAEAMSAATKAMVLGLEADQLPKLMEIARASARAFGTDVGFMFDSLSLGIGRQSRMLLDNLGIIVDAESAYRKYAEVQGIVGRTLTDNEKKQAFLNAAIEAGQQQVDTIGAAGQTQAEKIAQLEAAWDDFNTTIATFVANSPQVATAIKFWTDAIKGMTPATQNQNELLIDLKRNLNSVNEAIEASLEKQEAPFLMNRNQVEKEFNDLLVHRERLILAIRDAQARDEENFQKIEVIKEQVAAKEEATQAEMINEEVKVSYIASLHDSLTNRIMAFRNKDFKDAQEKAKAKQQLHQLILNTQVNHLETFLQKQASTNKAAAIAWKGIQMGRTVINTAEAISEAAPNPVLMAFAAAAGAAQIATIASVGFAEGTDSVPAMLTPGEMVVPRNFAQAIRDGDLTLGGGGGGGEINIFIQGGINPGGSTVEEMAEELGFAFEREVRTARGF